MTSLWLMALLAGAALGLGVGVLLYVTAAPARPALAPLMNRAGSRPAPVITVTAPAPVQRNGWSRLAAARLSRWVDVEWLNSPDADLAVIEKSRQQFLLERVGPGNGRAAGGAYLGGDAVGIGNRTPGGDPGVGECGAGGAVLVGAGEPGHGCRSGAPP